MLQRRHTPLGNINGIEARDSKTSNSEGKSQLKAKENIYDVIYDVVRAIPRGRISTYGAIAAAIGAKSGARVVGYALKHCFNLKPKVPAHRVLNRVGLLSGKHHHHPIGKMQQLLEKEGIKVKDDKVVNFDAIFWDPVKELMI